MHAAAEALSLCAAFVALVLAGVSLQDPFWKESSNDGSVIITSNIYENLWMSCASDSTGVYNCRDFPSLLALPGEMHALTELAALALAVLGWILCAVVLPHRYWRVSSVDGSMITASAVYESLWISCTSDATGVHTCRELPSLVSLPGFLQASRALMITALVLGSLGTVATLVGMQCSKAGGDNLVLKGRVAGAGGAFFLLQGLCTMTAVSWYAFNITQEFFDPYYPGTKFEIGQGLYIGWCSATLAILGGLCLLFSCKLALPDKLPIQYQPTRATVLSTSRPSAGARSQNSPVHYDRNAYV